MQLCIYTFYFLANAIEIDGKLDFGGSHSSTSSFRSDSRDSKNAFTPFKYSKTVKASDDFENIGVVCTSSGCNTTESSGNNNSEDHIQTDILVHVQTKVDYKHNKSETVGETPDVPIVVGYGGSQLDATVDDDNNRSLGSQSIFVPNVPEIPNYMSISNINSKYNPSSSQTPSIISGVGSVSGELGGLDSSGRSGTFYPISPPAASRIDNFGGSFDNLNPSIKSISGFYVTNTSPVASRVDYIGRTFDNLDPAVKTGIYNVKGDPEVNINIKPVSSVPINPSESDRDIKYKDNGIEIKIPHFDPSHHSHYYGENPPPQYVWYSKKNNGFNPVEFKTVKSTWTPSVWNRKAVPHRHGTTIGEGGVKCTCKEDRHDTSTGLRWYPGVDNKVPSFNDPGSQINDKLAPLN